MHESLTPCKKSSNSDKNKATLHRTERIVGGTFNVCPHQ
jgi:hypothetical protein